MSDKSSEGETVESPAAQSTTVKDDDVDWHSGDFFPLLLLPKEIIILILHMLSTADRFRARVCKALYDDVDIDLLPLIKSIAKEQLFVWELYSDPWLAPHVDEASFNSWIMDRKSVFIWEETIAFSGQDLFNLFNGMASGQSPMVALQLDSHRYENTRDLLNLMGITYIKEEEKFRSTMRGSCMFVTKDTYNLPIWLDHAEEMSMFPDSPNYSLFICCGRMRVTVRRWTATDGVPQSGKQYYNELAIERFDENGEKPDGMREAAYDVTMADLWRDTEKYEKLPSYRFQIVEQ